MNIGADAKRPDQRWVGVLAAIVTITIWTSFIVIGRASARHNLTPLDMVFARTLGAALVLLPWGWWIVRKKRQADPAFGSWLGLSPMPLRLTLLLGFFGGLAYAPLAYTAFFFAPAAHGAVLMPGMLPLSTALIAAALLGERFTRRRALGLALIALAAALVGGASLLKAFEGGEVWKGDVLFVCASSCWAVYSVLARKHQADAVYATIGITAFAAVCFLPLYAALASVQALPFGWVSHLAVAPWQEIAFQMVVQGMGSVVISGISFTLMLKHFGPVKSTMLTALVPSLASLGAVVFLNEPLHWNLLAGLALALCGIALGVLPKKTTTNAHAPPPQLAR